MAALQFGAFSWKTLPGPERHPWKATGTEGRLFEGLAAPSTTSGEKANSTLSRQGEPRRRLLPFHPAVSLEVEETRPQGAPQDVFDVLFPDPLAFHRLPQFLVDLGQSWIERLLFHPAEPRDIRYR